MNLLQIGDEVTIPGYGDEPFTIIAWRADGRLADLESPFRSQLFCQSIGALTPRCETEEPTTHNE